jgi:23S rRNA pseudouridine955/2504/2580 synthase
MSGVEHRKVVAGDAEMRLDRWFLRHFPDLPRGRLQKLLRTGQIRVDGKRAKAGLRLVAEQEIRIPPIQSMPSDERPSRQPIKEKDITFVRDLILHMDDDMIILDKPTGLAVQGGSSTKRHLDGMLDALRFEATERPKLVHRLDKDTSGVMVLARSTAAARELGRQFVGRDVRKIYWAITVGLPERDTGRIDLSLAKNANHGHEKVSVDEEDGKRAITDFQILERAGKRLTWLALWPRTGRTHQLRAHCAAIGCPILGDGKYGGRDAFVDGLPAAAKKLQLFAREIVVPKLSGKGEIRVTAQLPPHMLELWKMFEFENEPAEEPFVDID